MRPFGWTQCTAIVELMPYMPPLPSHKYQRGFSCLGTASCGMCRWSPNYFSVPSGYSSKKIIQNPKGESEFGALLKDRKGVWTLREAVSWYHIATCRIEPQNAHFLNKSSPSPVVKLMLKLTRGISIWRPILGGFSTPTHRLTKEGLKGIGSQMQMVYSGAQSAPSLGILLDFTWKSGSCLSGRNLNPYFIPAPPRPRTFFFLQGGVTLPSDREKSDHLNPVRDETTLKRSYKMLRLSVYLWSALPSRGPSWELGIFTNTPSLIKFWAPIFISSALISL